MALELVANEDLLVEFTPLVVPPDAMYTGDVGIDLVSVVPTLSKKCKAEGKKVATTSIVLTWPPEGCVYTSATYAFGGGAGSVMASAVYTKAQGNLVLREGDAGTCAGAWSLIAAPFTPLACSCTVAISDAGQSTNKAQ